MELTLGSGLSYVLGGRKSALVAFGVLQVLVLLYATVYYSDYIIYLPLVLFGLAYVWLSMKYPLLWVCTAIILHIPLFLQSSGEVTSLEEIIGVYIYGLLGLWFFNKLVSRRERIITSRVDLYLVIFLSMCVCSFILALIYESELGRWFRELAVFLGFLYYFPVREVVRANKKNLWIILSVLCSASLFIGALNLLNYRALVLRAIEAWQLWGSRRVTSTTLFLAALLGGSAFFFFAERRVWRVVSAIVTAFFGVFLLITFARGFWLSAALGLAVMFLLLDWRRKRRFVITSIVAVAIAVLAIFLVLGPVAQPVLKAASTRLLTVQSSTKDRSLQNRMIESEAVWTRITQSPVVGYGLGSSFTTFNLFINHHVRSWYIHNGFLFLWFKLGLIGLLLFLLIYFTMMWRSYRVLKVEAELWRKGLALAIFCILLSMLVVSYTSGQFYERGPVLIYALCWGILAGLTSSEHKLSEV